ncbi:helix-turn-helix transcriptional regulator [Clostridiaceae bacterium NSJ-31]|uniref:Helix-turn-helix transcriptional regulator n=1 Tax=Ligaoa zhengdingensis TaxID=2763658 RepID=A0A926DY53_9FIRM|nr:helix-turn-helix transcriptional regulator [Ligaoa zhengdingensis]
MIASAHTLGERCRAYRKLHGLTQTQFAAIVGASRSQICRIERSSNHVGAAVIDAVRLFIANFLPEKN